MSAINFCTNKILKMHLLAISLTSAFHCFTAYANTLHQGSSFKTFKMTVCKVNSSTCVELNSEQAEMSLLQPIYYIKSGEILLYEKSKMKLKKQFSNGFVDLNNNIFSYFSLNNKVETSFDLISFKESKF
ncbi:MAG: hypothetical protein ACOYOK_12825 [Pseudobdellovibrionaceae bacterium]